MLISRMAILLFSAVVLFITPANAQESAPVEPDVPAFVVGVTTSAEPSNRSVSGFVVGPGNLIITSAAIVDGRDDVYVRFQGEDTGHTASIEAVDSSLGVALLRVAGVDERPVGLLSDADVASGDPVQLGTYQADGSFKSVSGAVSAPSQFKIDGKTVRFLQHNALAGVSNYGAPVMNECGQVAAIGVPNPVWSSSRAKRLNDPEGELYALEREPLIDFLIKWSVVPPLADSECVPAARRAEEASDRAEEVESEKEQVRQELDSARDELEKAKEQAKEAAEKAEEAQKEADRLEQKAEELRNDADATEVERKEAEEAATRAADIAKNTAQQAAAAADLISDLEARIERLEAALKGANTMLIAGAVAFVLLGGLALIFLLRRGSALRKASESRDRAEAELARRFADIECRGRDPEGHPHAFKISGDALVKNPEGLIVGRQPSSSAIVFNHPEVSRTHVRVKLEEDRVFVEDLDSTNGTKINGESLVPGEPRELKDGDELALGAIVMGVKFHDV